MAVGAGAHLFGFIEGVKAVCLTCSGVASSTHLLRMSRMYHSLDDASKLEWPSFVIFLMRRELAMSDQSSQTRTRRLDGGARWGPPCASCAMAPQAECEKPLLAPLELFEDALAVIEDVDAPHQPVGDGHASRQVHGRDQ